MDPVDIGLKKVRSLKDRIKVALLFGSGSGLVLKGDYNMVLLLEGA